MLILCAVVDSQAQSSAPTITSFSPSEGRVGDELIIKGTNFNNASSVFIGSLMGASFTIVSNTEIRLRVHEYAATGKLQVWSSSGKGSSSTDFTVTGAPTISGFTPSSGPVGAEITVNGQNLKDVTRVYIGNGWTTDFTMVSDTELRVRVPALASTGRVVVRTLNGQVTSSTNFTVTGAPTISGFTPSSGPVGAEITVNGQNLKDVTKVSIGIGSTTDFKMVSDTELRVRVPALASTGRVVVTTLNGQVTASGIFTVEGAPVVNSFDPSSARVGDVITITGQNFAGATHVYIGSGTVESNAFLSVTENEIKVKVPYMASSASIVVRSINGQGYSSGTFTVEGSPIINSFSPSSGPIGTTIKIYGQNFTGTTDIYINQARTTNFSVISDTELWVTVPATATTGRIRVIASGGSDYSSATYTITNAYITITPNTISFTDVPANSTEVQQYQVSGQGLTNGVAVSLNISDATSPFTISTALDGVYSRSLDLTGVSNNRLNATTIYVRYAPLAETAAGSPHTGSVIHTQGSTSNTLAINATAVGPMPVELVFFTAKPKDRNVVFEWRTAAEKDNSHFEIEMAVGSLNNFTKVATVASKVGNSSTATSYKHQQLLLNYGNTLYFRLKQVDFDGTSSYSNIVAIETSAYKEQTQPKVVPNPVNSRSKLVLNSNESVKASMHLSSLAGKRIYSRDVIVLKGPNELDLPMVDTLEKGMYILTIELGGKVYQVKFIKQ
ncbi:hypothetical protein GCM10027293_31610 [Pontibacter aydingkolensis]